MIQSIIIEGLNGHRTTQKYVFNPDLNIITGQNGCGKTTLLKILWYINSGKISKLENEVIFHSIQLKINNNDIVIKKEEENICGVFVNGNPIRKERDFYIPRFRRDLRLDSLFNGLGLWSSIYFPTFRRVEGGYTMNEDLFDAFTEFSRQMSKGNKHHFISSVSTRDIDDYLSTQYSRISAKSIEIQQSTFSKIRRIIISKQNANDSLTQIENLIQESENEVKKLKRPFSILENTILHILHHKGIEIDDLVFGDQMMSISSDKLSAGEKQMLSFLCYNAFARETIIYIDEPELSLHPDWQRKLMPILMSQGTGNQYIIATHSPFIYAQYPEKEIEMDVKGE